MTLIHYLRGAVLGAALAFGCGPKEGFDNEEREERSLEVRVQRDITDSNGLAFSDAQEILVRDAGSPVANEEVTLYSVISQGDVYLTEANGGGIALFPESRRRHGRSSRELNVNVPQPVQGSSESLLSGLLRWSLTDFSCVSAESVPANGVPRVIIYSDENGRQVAFGGDYSRLQFDSPAQFYSFDPMGEGVPLLIPDAMAQAIFSKGLYNRVREECRGSSSASCSGEVLFEDEFDGKELDEGMWDIAAQNDRLVLNNGVLEMYTSGGAGLQSRSTYSLSDGPLCFEARWRVREREGTGFVVDLYNLKDLGTIGFVEREGELSCFVTVPNNTTLETCNAQTMEFHTTRFEANEKQINFYIDNKIQQTLPLPSVAPDYLVDVSCSSRDGSEKSCFLDYLKLER